MSVSIQYLLFFSTLTFFYDEVGRKQTSEYQGWRQGRARGYSPPSEHASPVGRWDTIFSEIFGIYSTLEIIS